ncbi:MAG: LVIVD repeat-containing protein [Candidatus Hodarchaeales archaeon]|jgi:hypothetical protein
MSVEVREVVKFPFGFFLIIYLVTINGYVIHGTNMKTTQGDEWYFTELARLSTGGDAYTIKVENDYCYISCGYSGFRIFDISNLSAPYQVAHIPQTTNGYAHQFILHENIAFIGNGYGGIWIINCTNPEEPNIITEYEHDYSWDVQLKEDMMYAGNGHIQPQESVTVTNVSDITKPIHVKTILTDDDITDLQRIDHRLYAASSTDGLLLFDITNSTDPIYLGKYVDAQHPDIYLVSFDVVEEYAFVVYYQYGMQILNISDATNITLVTELVNENTDYYSIHVRNDIAYISDINNGILLINVSSSTDPEEIVQYTYENCGTNDIFEQGEILFIADRNIGLLIFNTTKGLKTSTTTVIKTNDSSEITTTTTTTTPLSEILIFLLFGLWWLYIKRKR